MANIKIDYVLKGKRSSVSIDPMMFSVFSIRHGSEDNAREIIKQSIAEGSCYSTKDMTMSKSVQNMIFRDCCRPSLIDKYDNDEYQYDIEDF